MEKKKKISKKIVLPETWSFKKKVWFWLTCWRPLTLYETQKYNIMIIKLAQGINNLYTTQQTLIKNNNILTKSNTAFIKDITELRKMATGTPIDKNDPAFK